MAVLFNPILQIDCWLHRARVGAFGLWLSNGLCSDNEDYLRKGEASNIRFA
jgi:hypothetical protein